MNKSDLLRPSQGQRARVRAAIPTRTHRYSLWPNLAHPCRAKAQVPFSGSTALRRPESVLELGALTPTPDKDLCSNSQVDTLT